MKNMVFAALLLSSAQLFAASPGDSIDRVIAEKGKPRSRVVAGNVEILNYSDVSIEFRDGALVDVKTLSDSHSYVTAAVAQPASVHTARNVAQPADSNWTTDFQSALATASSEKKNAFLFFTGSDWCGWCKKLNREILSTPQFAAYASEKLVLVDLDFPRHTPQPEELHHQNESLAAQFGIHSFPTVIVINPEGKIVAKLGYQEGGPEPFLKRLRAVEP